VVILDPPTKGHVIQRMRSHKIAMVQYAQPYDIASIMQYCDVITNPRWRTAAILKIAKSPYLSENHPILIKFGTLQQILNPMTVAILKIAFLAITH